MISGPPRPAFITGLLRGTAGASLWVYNLPRSLPACLSPLLLPTPEHQVSHCYFPSPCRLPISLSGHGKPLLQNPLTFPLWTDLTGHLPLLSVTFSENFQMTYRGHSWAL